MKTLYLAKEPDAGVRNDLSRLSGEITIVDCLNAYGDYYRKMGYNVISKTKFFELDGDMRFDFCIGNPPYSDRSGNTSKSKDLDDKFVEICTNISNHVKLIIRSKHFSNSKSKFRRNLFATGNVKSITRLDDKIFPIQNTETCIIEWDVKHTGPATITYKDGTVVEKVLDKDSLIKLDNPNFVESVENNLADRVIVGKLYRNKIQPGDHPMVELCGKEGPIITNVAPGLENTGRNSYGVIMNTCADWGSIGKLNLKPYDASICFSVTCLQTDTEEEAIQLLEYLQTDEVKEIIRLNMTSFHPTKSLFAKIPSPL